MRFLAASASAVLLVLAGCSKDSSDDDPPPFTVSIDTPASDVTILKDATVNFTATALNGTAPITYLWTFSGAAPNSTLQNPSVQFTAVGVYPVTVTATDAGGLTAQDTVTVTVKTVIATITQPTSNVSINAGDSVTFQGAVTGGTPAFTYLWTFSGANPDVTVLGPFSVTFNSSGTYLVTFRVTDSLAATDTDTVTVTVGKQLDSIEITPAIVDLVQGNFVDFTVTATYVDLSTSNVTSAAGYVSEFPARVSMSVNRATVVSGTPMGRVLITATYTQGSITRQDTAEIWTLPLGHHTKAQIKSEWNTRKPVLTSVSYLSNPIMQVDDLGSQGQLSAQMITDGINWTNFYRYLAGLPSAANNATNEVACQKGAHVLVMVDWVGTLDLPATYSMPHDPPLPTNASVLYQGVIYNPGHTACGESNIYRGWFSPPGTSNVPTLDECVDGWMDDFGNEDTLGHRRWILHPNLKTTAFGMVWANHPSQNHTDYAALMHVFDTTNPTPSFDFIAYPSEGFYPKLCFQDPPATPQDPDRTLWSFAANSSTYGFDAQTTVTVVRKSDGANLPVTTTIQPAPFGYAPTISFNPNESTLGETYTVTINNINVLTGGHTSYTYWVTFFDVTAP